MFFGQDQKFESAAQAFPISHHGSQLHKTRRERKGKFQGDNFAYFQLTAQGRSYAVLAKLGGSAPACRCLAFAKYRCFYTCVKMMTRKLPLTRVPPGGCVDLFVEFRLLHLLL